MSEVGYAFIVLVAFHYCDKILELINLKRGKVYFSSQLWRSQSIVGWSCCFWACVKWCILVAVQGRGSRHLMDRSKRRRGRVWVPTFPQGHPSVAEDLHWAPPKGSTTHGSTQVGHQALTPGPWGPWSRAGPQCCRVGGRCVCPSMSNGICTEGLCSPGHLGAPPRKLCAHFFMAQGLCCVQKSRHLLRARRKPERKSWRVKKFYNHPDPLTPPTMSCFCRHKSDPRQKVWKSSLSITKWNAAC